MPALPRLLRSWSVIPAALLALASLGAAVPPSAELTAANLARLERGGGPLPEGHAVAVRYEGSLAYQGHYATPGETHTFHSLRRIAVAAPELARQDWTTWTDADTTRSTETTLLLGDRVLVRDDAGAPWRELRGREAHEAAYTILAAAPPLTAAHIRRWNGRGLTGGPLSAFQTQYVWPDSLGRMEWDLDGVDQPFSYTALRPDPRRGTVVQDAHVFGTSTIDERVWPDSLRTMGMPADVSWVLSERRVAVEEGVALSEFALPAVIQPPPPPADTVARLVALAPGAWAVELPDANTRSLAVEFRDHLVLLETSSDLVRGERIRALLRAHFPGKPVRFVAFGHHHPDYTGGLRVFLADSAEVVCAGANASFVDEIAHQNFSVWPDRLWRQSPTGASARVDTLVAGRWRHADAANEVVALDIGARSNHTEHYLVFWLPRQKLLFEGDLGFFTRDGAVRASSRAAGLLQAIDEAKIAPATIVQSWPVNGNAASVPTATLRALVADRTKP